MATATLTTPTVGAECLEAELLLPRSGVPTAHALLSGDVSPLPGEAASLTLAGEQDGQSRSFAMTVRRSFPWQGRTRCVLVGGAGGLRAGLPPRDHVAGLTSVSAFLVVQGIVTATGEILAPDVEANLSGIGFPSWRRAGADALGNGGSGLEALDALVYLCALQTNRPAMTWRILDDGTLWIGEDTYPDATDSIGETWIDDGDDGRIECAPPIAAIRPGTTITTSAARKAERVTYRVTDAAARCEVLYTVAGDIAGREVPAVYQESHGATVKAQQANGSLDVQCDDARLAGLRKVPFCPGIVGCNLVVPAGERVRVAFQDGSPAGAYAYGLDMDTGAALAAARVTDISGRLAFDGTSIPPRVYYSPDASSAYVAVPLTGPNPPANFPGTTIAIATGSAEVKIR